MRRREPNPSIGPAHAVRPRKHPADPTHQQGRARPPETRPSPRKREFESACPASDPLELRKRRDPPKPKPPSTANALPLRDEHQEPRGATDRLLVCAAIAAVMTDRSPFEQGQLRSRRRDALPLDRGAVVAGLGRPTVPRPVGVRDHAEIVQERPDTSPSAVATLRAVPTICSSSVMSCTPACSATATYAAS
jgi:hypothetical protein